MNQRIRAYVAVIVGAGAASAMTVYYYAGFGDTYQVGAAAFFALLVMLAHVLRYEGSRSGAVGSITFLPILASVVVAPTVVTPVAIASAVMLGELSGRRPPIRVVFNAAQLVLSTSSAILAMRAFAPLDTSEPTLTAIAGLLACAFFFHGLNTSTVAGAIALDSGRPFSDVWYRGAAATIPYDAVALPVVYLLAWGYQTHGPGPVLLFVLPIFGLRQLYKKNWESERDKEELLQLMVRAVEASNPHMAGHSQRVSSYASRIGRVLRLGGSEIEQLRIAALLHDVGKIYEEFAPLLRKEGNLTLEERRLMQTHATRSAELAGNVSRLKPLIAALRSHHERWDGTGYPDRLADEQIPFFARIIAVADTVDAMTSSRPYRAALDISEVRRELEACRGAQFDPTICDAILTSEGWADFAILVETSRPEPSGSLRAQPIRAPASRRRSIARVLGLS